MLPLQQACALWNTIATSDLHPKLSNLRICGIVVVVQAKTQAKSCLFLLTKAIIKCFCRIWLPELCGCKFFALCYTPFCGCHSQCAALICYSLHTRSFAFILIGFFFGIFYILWEGRDFRLLQMLAHFLFAPLFVSPRCCHFAILPFAIYNFLLFNLRYRRLATSVCNYTFHCMPLCLYFVARTISLISVFL